MDTHTFHPLNLNEVREDLKQVNIVPVACDPYIFGMLTQVRHTIRVDETEELAGSILVTGQLHQGISAALTPEEALKYVS